MLKLFIACFFCCLISPGLWAGSNDFHRYKPEVKKNVKERITSKKNLAGKKPNGKKGYGKRSRGTYGVKGNAHKSKRKNNRSPKLYNKKVTRELDLDDFSRNKGTFRWPLEESTIKTGFGPYKAGYGSIMGNNPGLTLEAAQGSCVQSVFEGVVTDLFEMEGHWGVTIQHGDYFTVYGNLATVDVSEYEKIASGAIIGKAASNSEGNAELEFLLLKKNKNIDPGPWIKKK